MRRVLFIFAVLVLSVSVSSDSHVNANRILRSFLMNQNYNESQKQYSIGKTDGNTTTTITMSEKSNTFGFDYAEMVNENEMYHILFNYNPFTNDEVKKAKFTYSFIDANHEERQFIINGEIATDFPESELDITNFIGNRMDQGSFSYYTTKNRQAIENLTVGIKEKVYEALQSIDEMFLSEPELVEKNIDIRSIGFVNIEKKGGELETKSSGVAVSSRPDN